MKTARSKNGQSSGRRIRLLVYCWVQSLTVYAQKERLLPYGLFSFASSFSVARLNPEGMFGRECRAS